MPKLDPDLAEVLAAARSRNLRPYQELPIKEAKAEAERRNAVWNENPPPLPEIEDIVIEGPRGPLKVRLYAPAEAPDPSPAVLYFHGGGWVICSIDTHDAICRRLARAGGFRVASIEYALAPENPYPQGLADCVAAIRWFAEHGASEGIEPDKLALAGDSAGANLSLAACLRLRDTGELGLIRAAALVYGCFSPDYDSPSHAAFGGGDYLLSSATMRWFLDQYCPDVAARSDPLVSPLFADLRDLPPLYVSAAELDPLRDDSERLARRLVDAGVPLDFRLWRGLTHASFSMSSRVPAVQAHLVEVAQFLRGHLYRK